MNRIACFVVALAAVMGAGFSAKARPQDSGTIVRSNCGSCHTLAEGQGGAEGPNLFNVVGRKAGSAPGYSYTDGFKTAFAGKSWTPEMLDHFLTDTEKAAPGTGMIYFNDNAKERAKIIQYLSKLK